MAEYCAPLTSFDWNEADPTIIGSCSIDTTCTIWDVAVCKAYFFILAYIQYIHVNINTLSHTIKLYKKSYYINKYMHTFIYVIHTCV